MSILPKALQDLIEAFGSLPGVGSRTAERYAYYLIKNSSDKTSKLSDALLKSVDGLDYCKATFALVPKGEEYSDLYKDPKRNKKLIAVVAEPFDIVALENTGKFEGTYHVLGGLLSPIDGINPSKLHIPELIKRVSADQVEELVIATNASVEGESTALYIKQQINNPDIKISRLARGLSVGVDLEYADQVTLARALEGRQTI
ncbi:MAG: recombination mediator RecR [bacterium]